MPDATAMAVRDGTVVWLGSDDVGLAQFPDAEVVDLDGAFVSPAFVDSHVHLTATGLTLAGLDLRAATSARHCLQLIAEYAQTHPDGPIWGHGWDESSWPEPTPPSTDDLDAVVGDRPAYLARVDVHSAAASTALRRLTQGLQAAQGFDAQRPLTADAHHLVRAAARDRLTPQQRARARLAALDLAAANGIVAVHECAGPDIGGLDDWQELRASRHGVEIVGYWGEAVTNSRQSATLVEATGARGLAGDLFVDGALGSRTAWLKEPYADAPDRCGNTYLGPADITAHLHACTEAGITAGFHVIGDAAVSAVVDALQMVVDQLGAPRSLAAGTGSSTSKWSPPNKRADSARGVIASVQPNFDALWGGDNGMYAQRLGPDRGVGLNPLALLASQGGPSPSAPIPRSSASIHGRRSVRRPAPDTCKRGIDARGVLGGDPRRLARGRGTRRRHRNAGSRRARLLRGVGDRRVGSQRARQLRATMGRPTPDRGCPPCRGSTQRTGCRDAWRMSTEVSSSMAKSRREWARANDDTDSFPVITDEPAADDEAAGDEPAPSRQEPHKSGKCPRGSGGSAMPWWRGCHASAPPSPGGCCCA